MKAFFVIFFFLIVESATILNAQVDSTQISIKHEIYLEGDLVYEIQFKDSLRHGWTFVRMKGTLIESLYFVEDDTICRIQYYRGKPWITSEYVENKLDGRSIHFDKKGRVVYERYYVKDKLVKETKYRKNGVIEFTREL